MQIHPREAYVQMDEMQRKLFIYTFFEAALQVRSLDGFHTMTQTTQNDATQFNSTQRASMDAGVKTPQCPHLSSHFCISSTTINLIRVLKGVPFGCIVDNGPQLRVRSSKTPIMGVSRHFQATQQWKSHI